VEVFVLRSDITALFRYRDTEMELKLKPNEEIVLRFSKCS
jgi:hypothetical protein